MSVRLGPNIHNKIDSGQEYSAADKEKLAQLLIDLRPSAIVVMNNKDWSLAYKIMLPDTNVIFRLYHKEEGHLWDLLDADTYWHNMQGYIDPRITLYVTNESNGKCEAEDIPVMRKAVAWWVRLMELASKQGVRLCLPNWSSGSPDLRWITDDTLWPVIKPLYDAFQKYPTHYYGAHEYFWHSIEDSKHHVGRHADVMAALQKRGDYKLQWILTEVGSDDIWSKQKRGFKNTVTEEQYADVTEQAKNTVWNVSYIVGITWYCHGAVTEEWNPFNTARAEIFNRRMIQANNKTVEIPTPAPPPPAPESWATGIAETVSGGAAIRFQPNVASKLLATVHSSDPIGYDRNSPVNGWWKVKKDGVVGYASTLFLTKIIMGELPAPNPDTTPTPLPQPPHPDTIIKQRVSELWAERNKLDARRAQIDAELDDLLLAS